MASNKFTKGSSIGSIRKVVIPPGGKTKPTTSTCLNLSTCKQTAEKELQALLKRLQVPNYLTSLSSAVCPKKHSTYVYSQVRSLKRSLLSNTGSITQCSKGDEIKFREDGVRRSKRSMTLEEEEVLDELQATSNIKNLVTVRKEGCTERGTIDETTNTINMCKSCRYTVTVPSK